MRPATRSSSPRRRPRFGGAGIFVLGFFALAGLAIAQTGTRQSAGLTFDQKQPARGTGVSLRIDYVNPDDPEAKPFAVERVVTELPEGSNVDTSVPARCGASDAELIAQGAAACPPGSTVGGGAISLDTGLSGPARILENDVTALNNRDELILLLESKSDPSTRAVSRARLEGATLTSEVPPIPGGPPDGFTAIKQVRLEVNSISAGTGRSRRSYVTTPASCPEHGNWTSVTRFTYRDGVSQSVSSTSPCVGRKPASGTAPSPTDRPRLGASGTGVFPRGGVDAGGDPAALETTKHAGSLLGALGAVAVLMGGVAAWWISRHGSATRDPRPLDSGSQPPPDASAAQPRWLSR